MKLKNLVILQKLWKANLNVSAVLILPIMKKWINLLQMNLWELYLTKVVFLNLILEKSEQQLFRIFIQFLISWLVLQHQPPNDYMEIGNHSEFCGVMTRSEMLSMFFVHDGGQTSKWRLKGHATDVFWQWLATFSVFVDNPANIGYQVSGYDLPKLNINEIIVDGNEPIKESLTLTERREARKESLELRCKKAAKLVNSSNEKWLVWCDLNDESARLSELISESVEVKGSDKSEYKSNSMLAFSDGTVKCLITKPKIAGFGMNWQNCHNMIFTGLSDSYEQYYQAVRRCWRFGQEKPVNVYIIISAKEGCVKENIERKQCDFQKMQSEMTELTKEITKKELKSTCRISTPYEPTKEMKLPDWEEFTA